MSSPNMKNIIKDHQLIQ